jgi:hypothetical protein
MVAKKNSPPLIFFFPVLIVIMIVIPFLFDMIRVKYGLSECGAFFYKCKNGWHYESNFLGQRIDIHYLVNYKGDRIQKDNFLGCGYNGGPKEYNELLMQIPGIRVVEENDKTRTYRTEDQKTLILDLRTKPHLPDIADNDSYRVMLSELMFKGTECEKKGPSM